MRLGNGSNPLLLDIKLKKDEETPKWANIPNRRSITKFEDFLPVDYKRANHTENFNPEWVFGGISKKNETISDRQKKMNECITDLHTPLKELSAHSNGYYNSLMQSLYSETAYFYDINPDFKNVREFHAQAMWRLLKDKFDKPDPLCLE